MKLIHSHVLPGLQQIPAESVNTCITSPPYWGLRDYGTPPAKWPAVSYAPLPGMKPIRVPKWEGEMGQEPTLEMFIGHVVAVFREVRRTLRDDGTAWVNMGDGYAIGSTINLKPKDMMGQPWRVAFALQADGWFLRSEIIWHKPNPMPECTRDRPTKAHEQLFLLSKSERYFYDGHAIRELAESEAGNRESYRGGGDYAQHATLMKNRRTPSGWDTTKGEGGHGNIHKEGRRGAAYIPAATLAAFADAASPAVEPAAGSGAMLTGRTNKAGRNAFRGQGQNRDPERQANREGRDMGAIGTHGFRNKRDVWTIPTEPFNGAHFATFPTALVRPCIRAGSPRGGVVLDCFAGSGTTGMVALEEGREPVLVELLAANLDLIRDRCTVTMPLALDDLAGPVENAVEEEPLLWEGEA